MDDLEKAVLEKIDEMREEIVKFHQQMIQLPSEVPPGKYRLISKFVADKMKEFGINTKVKRNNVIGKIGSEEGRSLIFNAHMDTVKVFDGWTKDPHSGEIIGNKIYGRGSSDDKSCVVAEIFAAKALLEVGADLNGNLTITAVVNEEIGGIGGAEYITNEDIVKGDACLVGDTPCDNPIAYVGGLLQVRFTIKGIRRHTMAYPDLLPPNRNQYSGINAIHKMLPIANFLMKIQDEFQTKETKYPIATDMPSKVGSVSITKIEGGVSHASVPDNCILHCIVSTIPEMDLEAIKTRILNFAEDYKQNNPEVDLTVQALYFIEPLIADVNTEFAKVVKNAFKSVYGEERDFKMFIAITDAHFFKRKGIETLLIGTLRGENNIHAQDEFVYIDDLINATKLYALTALNYLK